MNRRHDDDSAELQAARHITLTAYIEAIVIIADAASGTAATMMPEHRESHDLMMIELKSILSRVRAGETFERLTRRDCILLVSAGAILSQMDARIGEALAGKALGL